jgi:cathepsin B
VAVCVAACALASAQPASFDSRSAWSTCLWPINDQQQCGSCYAFASAEVVSNRLCTSTGSVNALRASPQSILDAENDAGNAPCNGGYPPNVLEWLAYQLTNAGVCTCSNECKNGCTPYIAGDCEEGTCSGGSEYFNTYVADLQSCSSATLSASAATAAMVSPDAPSIQAEIERNGPVVAAMSICYSFYTWFQHGPAGAYATACTPNSNDYLGGHAVKITGWAQDASSPTGYSWTIANSWGATWGNSGYFSLPLGQTPSACGVESLVSTVIVNDQTPASGTAPFSSAPGARTHAALAAAGRVHHHDPRSPAHLPAVAHILAHDVARGHSVVRVESYASQVVAGAHEHVSLRTVDASGREHLIVARVFISLTGVRTTKFALAVPVTRVLAFGRLSGVVVAVCVVFAVVLLARARRQRAAYRMSIAPAKQDA